MQKSVKSPPFSIHSMEKSNFKEIGHPRIETESNGEIDTKIHTPRISLRQVKLKENSTPEKGFILPDTTCSAFCAKSCYFYFTAHGSIVCFHLIHFMKFHHLCFNTVVVSTCKVWSEFHMFVIHHLCARQSVTQTQKAPKQTSGQSSISLHSHTPAHTPAHVHMHMLKCHRYKSYTHMKAQMHSKTYSHTHTHTLVQQRCCRADVCVELHRMRRYTWVVVTAFGWQM